MSSSAPPPRRPSSPATTPLVEPLEDRVLFAANGSIKGTAYIDLSGDGKKGKRETATQNMQVYLDTNDNQQYDAGEPLAITNKKGAYSFKKVPRLVQHVRAIFPDGYTTVNPAGGAWFADLRFHKSFTKRDFGLWPLSQGPPPVLGKNPEGKPEPPPAIVMYNTGVKDGNNADGTNTRGLLGGGPGDKINTYWKIEKLNPGGDPLQFQDAFYSFNPARFNGDFQPTSPQVDSEFIGPVDNGLAVVEPGTYLYATAFDIQGIDAATASFTGLAVADGTIADVRLNGQSLGLKAGPGQALPLAATSGFVAGVNTLEFVVENATPGPSALRVDGLRGTGQKIKPGPITLFSTGVAGPNATDGTNATRLTSGGLDPHYFVSWPVGGLPFYVDDAAHHYLFNNSLTSGKFGNAFVATDPSAYNTADLNTRSPQTDSSFVNPLGTSGESLPDGTYIYRTYFDLTGIDANSAQIQGTLVAADLAVDIYINGNATGQGVGASYQVGQEKAFTIAGSQGMVSGVNVLDFVVTRSPGSKGTALRVDGLRGVSTTAVNRPSIAFPLSLPLPPFPPVQPPRGFA